jgi:hypothetical protein
MSTNLDILTNHGEREDRYLIDLNSTSNLRS